MPKSSKMQLRAEIFSILNKYNDTRKNFSIKTIKKDTDFFCDFEDKEFLSRILLNEIVTGKKQYAGFCALFLINAIDKKTIEEQSLKFLKDSANPDYKKSFLLSVLKQKEIHFDYDEINSFIENLEQTASDGVKDFLKNTLVNPESGIDLLDFYTDISTEEKLSLLESLSEDNKSDYVINAFSIISFLKLSLEETNIIAEELLNTDSPYALIGLNNLLKNGDIKSTAKNKITKKIKEIKFKNPNYKNDVFTKNSKPYRLYISFVDGNDNFSVVFSRIDKKNLIDTFFATINIQYGITSVVGFYKIQKSNFEKILIRLFLDSPPIEISSDALVSVINYYKNKNIKLNIQIPYEFFIWENFLNDIEPIKGDLSEYINSKLNCRKLSNKELKILFNSKIVQSWFYTKNQSKETDRIFSLLNKNNIKSTELLENDIMNFIDTKIINNKNFISIFKTRLLLQAYVSKLAKFDKVSDCLYGICYSIDNIKMFLNYIFQKSIYMYLYKSIDKEYLKENRFTKDEKISFSEKEINNLINSMEEKWK